MQNSGTVDETLQSLQGQVGLIVHRKSFVSHGRGERSVTPQTPAPHAAGAFLNAPRGYF